MSTDMEEKQTAKVFKNQKYRSTSKQSKLNPNSSTVVSQKKSSPLNKKRLDRLHLTKEEIKHQRFINGLKKDIDIYLKKSVRESRFDSSIDHFPSIHRSCTTHSPRKLTTDSILISTMKNRQRSIEHFKRGELQRLTADVDSIVTGPVMKDFYTKFIQKASQQYQPTSPQIHIRLLEESLLQTDEKD